MPNQKKNKKVRPGQRAAATAASKPAADEPIESIYSSDEVSSDEWHEETYERPTPGGGYVIESFGSNLSAMRREKEGGKKKKKRTAAARKPEVFSEDRIKSAEMELSEKFGLGVSLSYIGGNPMFNPQMMKKSGKDYGQVMREFAAQNPKHSGKPAPSPKPLNFLELDSRLQKKICSKIPNFDSFEHMRQCSRVANVACEEVIRDGVASFKPLHQGEQLDDVVEDFENIDDMYYNIMPGHLGQVIFGGYDEMRQGAVETVKKALSRGPHIQLDIPSLVLDTYDVEELLPRLMSGHSSIRTLGIEATAISVDKFNQLCGQVKIEEVYLLHTEHTQRKNFLSCPNIGKLNKLRVRLYNQEMLSAMAPHPPRAITAIHTCTLSFDGMLKFLEEYVQGKREITCLDIHYANLDGCDFEEISRKMKAMHTMTPQKKYRLNRDKKNYVMINITNEQRQSPTGPSRITRVVFRKISH